MKNLIFFLFCFFSFFYNTYSQGTNPNEGADTRMPFDKVMYVDEHPYILVKGKWAKLQSIADLPIDTFINNAKEYAPRNWKRDIHQYLYYIMDEFQIKRGKTIKVSYEIKGKTYKNDFELKLENGDLAAKFHDSIVKSNRVIRAHELNTPSEFEYLNTRIHGYEPQHDNWISPKKAIHDLEYLEWEIDNNYSYAELKGFDYRLGLDAIRNDLRDGIATQDFALQLKMLMANFGDGHSRVSIKDVLRGTSITWLPFEIIKHNEIFYAFDTNTKEYYQPKHPQIMKINGINIEELFQIAKQMIPKTTLNYVESNATEYLFYMNLLLKMKKSIPDDKIEVTFSNKENQHSKSIKVDRYKLPKIQNDYLLKDTILPHNLGYIAMNKKMSKDESFIDNLGKVMIKMKDTDGLIIDIRRNSGGSREPLLKLLPYFIKETKIVNVARYRINSQLDHNPDLGYLKRRSCFPASISKSKYNEVVHGDYHNEFKEAVENFKNNFEPRYQVDDTKFTDFHYMAVHPNKNDHRYYYKKNVIVLIDEGCFSAADIFAAGIRMGDHVKLLGSTTGGGSGYSQNQTLPNSKIRVKLSSMVSYQPDGNLYDSHGVIPDIPIEYILADRVGKSDTMMEKAIAILVAKNTKLK